MATDSASSPSRHRQGQAPGPHSPGDAGALLSARCGGERRGDGDGHGDGEREQGADVEHLRSLLRAKYGLEFRVFMAIEKLAKRMRDTPRVAVWIEPAPTPATT